MMGGFETDVAIYLTIDGRVFIAPQFDIKWEMNEGGTCPDFVALDFSCMEVVVVEVTGAADWKPLAARVAEREARWFNRVRERLLNEKVITVDWGVRFLGFVLRDAEAKISARFKNAADVTFHVLEDAIVPWSYWNDRMQNGLPGNRRKMLNASAQHV